MNSMPHRGYTASIDFYLKECAESGHAPIKSGSGRGLMLRIPPEVHGTALVAAQAAGSSLNQWAAKVQAEPAHVGVMRQCA